MFRFIYTGCGAKSKNIFETKEECDKGAIDSIYSVLHFNTSNVKFPVCKDVKVTNEGSKSSKSAVHLRTSSIMKRKSTMKTTMKKKKQTTIKPRKSTGDRRTNNHIK